MICRSFYATPPSSRSDAGFQGETECVALINRLCCKINILFVHFLHVIKSATVHYSLGIRIIVSTLHAQCAHSYTLGARSPVIYQFVKHFNLEQNNKILDTFIRLMFFFFFFAIVVSQAVRRRVAIVDPNSSSI